MSMRMFIGTPDRDDVYVGTSPRVLTPDVLFSYGYFREWKPRIDAAWRDGCRIMLDSGAFSAYGPRPKVEPIDIAAHTRFIEQHADRLEYAAALDVIGNPEATAENYEWQRQRVDVFPTIHNGAPLWLLDHYLETRPRLLALGGLVGETVSAATSRSAHEAKVSWVRACFRRMVDAEGRLRVPVHGFGTAWGDLFTGFPWTTTDTAVANYTPSTKTLYRRDGNEMLTIRLEEDHMKLAGRLLLPQGEEYQAVEADVIRRGFTLDDVRDSAFLIAYNILVLRDGVSLVPTHFRDPEPANLF